MRKSRQQWQFTNVSSKMLRSLLFILFALFASLPLQGQEEVLADSTKEEDRIIVDLADFAEYIVEGDVVTQKLMKDIRQVQLRQGNTFMYCDTAIIIDKHVNAFGNVIIQQGDSINVFADSLVYLGEDRLAELFGNVILEKQDQKLFTERLIYSLADKKATYNSSALLTNEGTQLSSRNGVYWVDQDLAYFSKDVVVVDSAFTLQSDTLEYNTKTEVATFLGPTLIKQEEGAKIYCESGFYDIAAKMAEFSGNAQYEKEDQIATADIMNYDGELKEVYLRGNAKFSEPGKQASAEAIRYEEQTEITTLEGNASFEDEGQSAVGDTIVYNAQTGAFATQGRSLIWDGPQSLEADKADYNDETGTGVADGNVVWIDTAEQITIYSEHINYNKKSEFVESYGARPMMVSIMEEDSFYLAADTLISYKGVEEDSVNYFRAYHDVRFLRSDLQGKCDSLFFDGRDSVFQLIGSPILWSDSSQFIADSIWIYLDSNSISKIVFKQNALIINTSDEYFFNQIQGREMTAYLEEGSIKTMFVNGNAESIYYAQDDFEAYIAVNKSICSKMKLTFDEGDLSDIHFIKEPKSNVFPMRKANHEQMKLKGFSWRWKDRPIDVEDLREEKKLIEVPKDSNEESNFIPKDIEAKVPIETHEKVKN